MVPGGVATHEGAGEDFARVVVDGEDEDWVSLVGGPPAVRRAVVLPHLTDGGGLPAPARFGTWSERGHVVGEVRSDIGGHSGSGAVKIKALSQFIGDEGEIDWVAVGQELGEKLVGLFGPRGTMRTTRAAEFEVGSILQPTVTQLIKSCDADGQSLGGGHGIELALIEGLEDIG